MTMFRVWLLSLAFSAGVAAEPLRIPKAVPSSAAEFPIAANEFRRADSDQPNIRVGLNAPDQQIRIDVTAGTLSIYAPQASTPFWSDRAAGSVLVVPEGGQLKAAPAVKRVQIGSFRDQDKAQQQADRLSEELHVGADATWDSSRQVWRVRCGESPQAEGLFELLKTVRETGFKDAWIVSETRRQSEGGTLRLLDARWDLRSSGSERLLFVAVGGGRVTVEGKEYRGVIEIRRAPTGGLSAINELPLEEYLRGVVPLELGPGLFPELDAQKAQAIAARTYALANLGQFLEEGYDICDTPRCQVYGGAGAEHPLSDQAIRETRGTVLAFDGAPINALFTATCGGHTEDVETVFPEWRGAYLKGVPCVPDAEALARALISVRGRPLNAGPAPIASGRAALARTALIAAGLLSGEAELPEWRAQAASGEEIVQAVTALTSRAGISLPPPTAELRSRLAVWRWLGSGMTVSESGSIELLEGDTNLLLMAPDAAGLAAEDRRLVAALLERGLPIADESGALRPGLAPTRGELVALLTKLAEIYDVASPLEGIVQRSEAGALRVKTKTGEQSLGLDSLPWLVAESPAGWYRVEALQLLPGDKLLFATDRRGLTLLALKRRWGVGDDRRGTNYRWTETRDAAALQEAVDRVAPVGRLLDLKVTRRGVSGRVAELRIVGREGEARVEGFRIRRALDLPEILFDLEVQHESSGLLSRAIFRGRGWGHGVGLCQSGAYGMALRGIGYQEILLHYYPGASLLLWNSR